MQKSVVEVRAMEVESSKMKATATPPAMRIRFAGNFRFLSATAVLLERYVFEAQRRAQSELISDALTFFKCCFH